MKLFVPMLLMLGIVSFLIILLALEGVLAGNWATISGNIAPIAVVIGVIGVVLVILRR